MKPLSGRRAIFLGRVSAVAHWLEPAMFGLTLAGGIYLTTRQIGVIVLLHARGGDDLPLALTGVLWLLGVTMVTASLLFFHRKGRRLAQRLTAAGVAIALLGLLYVRELGAVRTGAFFGLTTLRPSTPFVEDYPARPKVRYEVNRWGLRGADFSEEKPAGAVRVAVVGDSFVFGSGVEADATLPALLDARLRERFPGARPEVLNLGVPGNNLRSHLAMLRIAEERLGADVLVLCLTLPNDLSEWDGQEERRAHARVGGFSLASMLFGYSVAIHLWSTRHLARELTGDGLAFLQRELGSYGAARAASGAPKPLVVLAYSFEDPRVSALIRGVPGATLVPSVPWVDEHYIPNDGHPTALGNRVFAGLVADAFQSGWMAP